MQNIRTRNISKASKVGRRRITDICVFAICLTMASTACPANDIELAATTKSKTPVSHHTSIAVLPFIDVSDDADNEYLSDGISEGLLNLLARNPELRVISRTSAFSYKGKDIKVSQVAQNLNVAHILKGSVGKVGNQVRITAQLIDANSDTRLWSETYDRKLANIFLVQNEIVSIVTEQLKIQQPSPDIKATPTKPSAYISYLQARYLGSTSTPANDEQAIGLYRQALKIDPAYDAAWAEMAAIYAVQSYVRPRPLKEPATLAREAATKALEINPDNALAWAVLGRISMEFEQDLVSAARHFETALKIEPTNPYALRQAARIAMKLARFEDAAAIFEFAIRIDPENSVFHANLGWIYLNLERWGDAITSSRYALKLNPNTPVAHLTIGLALLRLGEEEAALAEVKNESLELFRLIGLAIAQHAIGQQSDSDATLKTIIEEYEEVEPTRIAYVLANRGEVDRAFKWLEKATKLDDYGLRYLLNFSVFEGLHKDPRWHQFLQRIGVSKEQLAGIEFNAPLPE